MSPIRSLCTRVCALTALVSTVATSVAAQPRPLIRADPMRDALRAHVDSALRAVQRAFPGILGVSAIDLTDRTRLGVNDTLVMPQGSAIKVAILLELFRRADRDPSLLKRRVELPMDARTGGSGVMANFTPGSSAVSLEDLAVLMIILSDNTATNLLIDQLSMDSVTRTVGALGFAHTKLQRRMIRPEESLKGNENISTPLEAASIMARIATCDVPLSAESCRRLRALLEIPKSSRHSMQAPIPTNVRVAYKPGSLEGVETVWAIVDLPDRPYAIAIMTTYAASEDEASAVIRQVSGVVYDYFARLARATGYGTRVPLDVKRKP